MEKIYQPRDTFAFHRDFIDELRNLNPTDFGKAMLDIVNYALDGIDNNNENLTQILPRIRERINWYDECVENGKKGAVYGKLGGRPRNNPIEIENSMQNPINESTADLIKKLAHGYTVPQTMQMGNRMVKVKHIPPNISAIKMLRELETKDDYGPDSLVWKTNEELAAYMRELANEFEDEMCN